MVGTATAKKVTISVITALVCVCILSMSQTASASGTFKVTAGVHVREAASASSKSLTTVVIGSSVDVLEHNPAGWSKVQVGSKIGYIRSDFLQFSISGDSATFTATEGVHVRETASTNAKSLTVVLKGASVTVLSHDPAGWSKVQVGSHTGYIRSDFLKHAPTATASSGGTTSGGSAGATGEMQVVGNVNMRADASTSAKLIRLLQNGTIVEVVENVNGWSRVIHNGDTGYIRSDLLAATSSGTQQSGQTLYTTGSVNFRKKPSAASSADIIRTLSKGTAVSVIEKANDEWSKVIHNGMEGYIKTDLLTLSSTGETVTRYTDGNVNLRTKASTASSVIRTLSNGTAVTVLNKVGDWSEVDVGGTIGFIRSDLLVATASATGGTAVNATMVVTERLGANVRAGPGASYDKVAAAIPFGGTVMVLEHQSNGWSKVRVGERTGYIKTDLLGVGSPVEYVTMAEISHLLPTRQNVRVVDVRTGVSYNITIFSKGKHADYETSTRSDTDTMFALRNGVRSWSARPLWVYVGNRVFAAATHAMPHDVTWIKDNGIDGHLCLHFKDTVTDNKNYQADLRASVKEAYDKRPR